MINFKKGLRRTIIVVLSVYTVYFLFLYIFSGFIFWNIDYISKAKVINISNHQQTDLIDFSQKYFEREKESYQYNESYFKTLGFRIHPYKKYFRNYDGFIFKDKDVIDIENEKYMVKLPGAFEYFITQLWQFLLIPLFWIVVCSIYFVIEWVAIWIIKGFRGQ